MIADEPPSVCPTPCDDDCDEGCHEGHQPSWLRTHDVEACDSGRIVLTDVGRKLGHG